MKTTNRILLALFFLILAGISIALIYFRVQLSHTAELMGTGNVITEERYLGTFDAVRVNGNFNVDIHVNERNNLIISANEDIMEYVTTEIKNNTLVIDFQLRTARYKQVDIDIYINNINSIEVSSGGRISSTDTIHAVSFNHLVSSGAQSSLYLYVDNLHLESSSGSRAEIKGLASTVTAKANSGAQIRTAELNADIYHVDVSSGANAQVQANNELHVNASSGSSVRFKGSPPVQNFSTSGGANVRPL